MSTTTTVKQVRKHYAAVRTVNRNFRLRRYQGRNSRSTVDTLDFKRRQANELLTTLPRRLQGLLWEEHNLADRLSIARDEGQERPELKQRLARIRREIRAAS